MALPRYAVAILLSASACLGDPADPAGDAAPADGVRASISVSLVQAPDEEVDICEHLPPDGPCSLLCDHAALVEQYVPENTCAAFRCHLTNGSEVTAHACHPPD